ncbi:MULTISPECIES: urease accessory protein UreE [unclassified Ruegeria]|uniref:urease accessory protein UreE n=1 Tax=unclassified Ruegeria TaxID=2625375 RepID=UPI00148800CE|nr:MULTISPECIES: urease accessory protein UreE [unclassified Ruegeria]NOD36106.1 urease accessory protein UreE [Ruegeria sp. HKCCD7296]NOD45749.1 urease accessory protein UreE [Ruegeria sp. HKCCD5849]NOD50951.1 urease accessory protein UreE [Ruegeria sp. HKCCD5851]NOD67758.1 urease accessory protein UreE [Ruegeria sp. HKCCD7303]NOE35677.1 urease accessory protein UreE [Ruegeria sp. HKCCD7318]
MTALLCTARQYSGHTHSDPADSLYLTYDDRFLRRKVLTCESGEQILIDLAQTTSLDHGGALILDDGREVEIRAAPEALLQVTAPDLTRIAWHIGNRHTPCQIEKDRLFIQVDHVINDMLLKIGATVQEVHQPFTPEGGAYGHGRTHGHTH